MSIDETRCAFCGNARVDGGVLPSSGQACLPCVQRLGGFLREDLSLRSIFPALVEDEDEEEPEPMVRLADGRRVELRARTEELKQELSGEQRVELGHTFIQMGMLREALLELGAVLVVGEPAARTRALSLLFSAPLSAPDALERVRLHLLPV